jgi:hypothetical protein
MAEMVAIPVAVANNKYPINLDDNTNTITLLVSEILEDEIATSGEEAADKLLVKKEVATNKLIDNIVEKLKGTQSDLIKNVIVNTNYDIIQEKRFTILNKIRKNCIKHSAYHNHRYHLYKNVLFTCFRVPLIILSGINSFSSVGLQPYIQQNYISLITAMISLFCGILTSIELLINLQKRMELELESYKEYYKISVDVYTQLLRAPLDRGDKGDLEKFLSEKYNEYRILSARSNGVNMGERNFVDEFELDDIETDFKEYHSEATIIPDYGSSRCFMCPPCCKTTFLSCIQTIYHCCFDGLMEPEHVSKRNPEHMSHIRDHSLRRYVKREV